MPDTRLRHDHCRGYQMRAFAGRRGVWVQRHGDWDRPLHVWWYRDAWRVICFPCMTTLRTWDELFDGGYRSQGEAFDAALAHCRGCTEVVTRA